MENKGSMTSQKLRGGYYTPSIMSDFLTKWALAGNPSRILEPSVGDGSFLQSIFKTANPSKIQNITAIEFDSKELEKMKKVVKKFPEFKDKCVLKRADFFSYFNTNLKKEKFGAVIGNPPFIRYQYFEEKQRDEALKIIRSAGLNDTKLTNIWAPFLVAGMLSLQSGGRLAMVIPAEMLHVNYGSNIRLFLSKFPALITLIAFKKLVFPNVQQEIFLLLIEKNNTHESSLQKELFSAKINMIELENFEELKTLNLRRIDSLDYKKIKGTGDKWTKFFLSKKELKELEKAQNNLKISRLGNFAQVDVGTVTGANKFFVVSKDVIEKYNFQSISLPLVGRSIHLDGFIFTKDDWNKNSKKNIPSYLLNFPDTKYENYSQKMVEYIQSGEKNKIHERYKTRIRKRWYQVPSIWKPDAFLLRRSHKFPKLILNHAKSHTTDTMHRVKLKNGFDIESLTFCFYNSITMASSELVGRNHGGGVLEILPNDAETILFPYFKCRKSQLQEIDKMYKESKPIESILDYVDEEVRNHMGISEETTKTFRNIWKKLSSRRLQRHNQ